MTPVEVVLPKVDMDMDSGTISAWHVREGDTVRAGDILFDMETNKAVMEVESPAAGRIRDLAAITGEPVPVGTAVAWIDTQSEAVAESPQPRSAMIAASSQPAAIAPAPAAVPRAPTIDRESERTELRATPFARKTAREQGIALADVAGSGPRGRIVANDVEAYAERRVTERAQLEPGRGTLVPFSPARRIVAQRLTESARDVPHFFLSAQIEMTAFRAALAEQGAAIEAATGSRPTLTVLLAKLVGNVLSGHPLVNASVEGDAARLHPDVHVGVAMDREGELVVPVLRNASTRSLVELATDFARLRNAVRSRTITPAQMRGGTFSISNLGMYGVDAFTAIINPPECAILAVGRTVDTPVGRDGQVVLRPMATFTLSSDHRIVDGVVAARFMADLRRAIEDPTSHFTTRTS